jgi:hypothetical protein
MAVTVERLAGDTTIRPFTIEFPEADLEDLRARIAATRWPERETVEQHDRGGHFATWEQPDLLSEDVRATFRSLRTTP